MQTNESNHSSQTPQRRSGVGVARRRSAVIAALAGGGLVGALSFGCAVDGTAPLSGKGQLIGAPGNVDVWRNWSATLTPSQLNSDPTICSNYGNAFFVVTRQSDLRYHVNARHYITNDEWKAFGQRQFVSSPTCVFQQPFWDTTSTPSDRLFLMAGKSTDDRIYVIDGNFPYELAPMTYELDNPDWNGPWAALSSTQYGGNNGLPALGANREKVVVTFLDSGRIHAHAQTLPYTNSAAAWGARIQGPLLPTGVTASGVPAIIYVGGQTDSFVVMIRGVASGGAALYWHYFDGSQFVGSWNQVPVTDPVDSDPSLEWDGIFDTVSVYFRTGNVVTHTSAHLPEDLGVYPNHVVDELNVDEYTILGAPRALFGAAVEVSGVRGMVVRGYGPAATEPDLGMWYLHVQDNVLNNNSCSSTDVTPAWNESDVDCGGDLCAPCDDGLICNVDADCASHTCDGGICVAPPEPTTPCAAYCEPATSISWTPTGSYQSGNVGTGSTCREVTQYMDGLWCGNFATGKQLVINGTAINCSGSGGNRTPPAPQNGGYCVQTTPGNHAYAAYSLWDTTQGQTPL